MHRYKLSRQADQDLEDLWVYLAESDPIRADRQIAAILNRLPMIAQYPDMGRTRNDLGADYRSFPSKPYVIFYIKTTTHIEILRILHQSHNVEDLFRN